MQLGKLKDLCLQEINRRYEFRFFSLLMVHRINTSPLYDQGISAGAGPTKRDLATNMVSKLSLQKS